jgi:uncharacterized membrane protein YsdA (DUF1294 family)
VRGSTVFSAAVWVMIIYALVNLAAFIVFYLDKRAAVRGERRISERTLLIIALLGPLGALGSMRMFHHKTRKTKFLLTYLFLALHLSIIAYIIWIVLTG